MFSDSRLDNFWEVNYGNSRGCIQKDKGWACIALFPRWHVIIKKATCNRMPDPAIVACNTHTCSRTSVFSYEPAKGALSELIGNKPPPDQPPTLRGRHLCVYS